MNDSSRNIMRCLSGAFFAVLGLWTLIPAIIMLQVEFQWLSVISLTGGLANLLLGLGLFLKQDMIQRASVIMMLAPVMGSSIMTAMPLFETEETLAAITLFFTSLLFNTEVFLLAIAVFDRRSAKGLGIAAAIVNVLTVAASVSIRYFSMSDEIAELYLRSVLNWQNVLRDVFWSAAAVLLGLAIHSARRTMTETAVSVPLPTVNAEKKLRFAPDACTQAAIDERLRNLKAMLDVGIINREEYDRVSARIRNTGIVQHSSESGGTAGTGTPRIFTIR